MAIEKRSQNTTRYIVFQDCNGAKNIITSEILPERKDPINVVKCTSKNN